MVVCETGWRIQLSLTEVLFGFFHPTMTNTECVYVNHIILIDKMCISKSKYETNGHLIIFWKMKFALGKFHFFLEITYSTLFKLNALLIRY
jgi:hypothetical protein